MFTFQRRLPSAFSVIASTAFTRSLTAGFVLFTRTVKPAPLRIDRSDSLAFFELVFWPLASG